MWFPLNPYAWQRWRPAASALWSSRGISFTPPSTPAQRSRDYFPFLIVASVFAAWVLRDTLGMTGTKFGCGIAQCGACTVHVNGVATRSCSVPLSAVAGAEITTIEGLAQNGVLHKVQKAWVDHDVPQCGYCQSGMIMAATALLAA